MVLSIKEQIISLEEEMANTKGPGSKDKKKAMQEKIDELKNLDKETVAETPNKEQDSIPAPKIEVKGLPPYRKVSLEQVQEAEKAGKLCGFDPVLMTASIRD